MKLRHYQRKAIDAIYDYFSCNQGNPLIVAPTGAGKSVIIGSFIHEVMDKFAHQRVLVLTHVKELLEQNYAKLMAFWPTAPAGIYCAGMNKKQFEQEITFASIQSVYRKAHLIGYRSLILIDEAHLLSKDNATMYRKFLDDIRKINPKIKVIGLTATPYRLKSGMLHWGDDAIFTDIAYEISLIDLLKENHLAPLISKSSLTQGDLSSIKITAGEYNAKDMERVFDEKGLTEAALNEVTALAGNRKSWLFFCTGVKHAQHVCDSLLARKIRAACVTGETPKEEREAILSGFKSGVLQAVTNCSVLTTGFDHPGIDLIALLRPTKSPGLYVQMLGRGMRPAPGKTNCLVLDYAGNIDEHGPVTHVTPPKPGREKKKEKKEKEDWKICKVCRTANDIKATECMDCGGPFTQERKPNHEKEASSADIISLEAQKPEWFMVDEMRLAKHEKKGKPPSLKVTYECGLQTYHEWVCLEHEGFAQVKAQTWWINHRIGGTMPLTVDEALTLEVRKPAKILVRKVGKYHEIVQRVFV